MAKLIAKPYLKALGLGFRKSGIYPYNSQILAPSQLALATIYPKESDKPADTTSSNTEVTADSSETSTPSRNC